MGCNSSPLSGMLLGMVFECNLTFKIRLYRGPKRLHFILPTGGFLLYFGLKRFIGRFCNRTVRDTQPGKLKFCLKIFRITNSFLFRLGFDMYDTNKKCSAWPDYEWKISFILIFISQIYEKFIIEKVVIVHNPDQSAKQCWATLFCFCFWWATWWAKCG